MTHLISYDDPRSHDRFDVHLTPSLEFDYCRRHVSSIGSDPVVYEHLYQIPQPVRSIIQSLIEQKSRG